jgi:hypothetical protein
LWTFTLPKMLRPFLMRHRATTLTPTTPPAPLTLPSDPPQPIQSP